jgi:ABC-type branched-subunit amino acid transport system substrate-binding protein
MRRKYCWVFFVLSFFLLSSCATAPRSYNEPAPPAASTQAPPRDAESLLQQAEKEKKMGNIPKAISTWERIAQTWPNNLVAAQSLYEIGHIYLQQRQPEQALKYYDYLIYTYPSWDGIHRARLDQLRAQWMTGKKKQVMKEASPLWEASSAHPEVQVELAEFMADNYGAEGDVETAFDWLTAGFAVARTPEEKKALTKAMNSLLKDRDMQTLNKLLKKNPNPFMQVFIDFRAAQIEMQQSPSEATRERLRTLLSQNASHPIAPFIQAALRGTAPEISLPLNPDRVGCLVPVNGPYANYGEMVLRGISLAKGDWNAQHFNEQVTLVIKDAQADPNIAVRSFEELVKTDGVLAVVGPLGSKAAKAVTSVADKLGVPLLSLTQREEDLNPDTFAVPLMLDNRELVRNLVQYCMERLHYTRFAALYPDDRYGQNLSKIFGEVVRELGGELMASVSYKDKSTDFKEPIQKLMTIAEKNAPPTGVQTTPFEALFIPDQVQTVSLIAPQLPYNNVVGVTLLGTNLWGEGPIVEAGGVYVEQAIFATPFYADSQAPRVRAFKERYQELYQSQPSYLEAQAYDALMLLLNARSALDPSSIDRYSLLQSLFQIHKFEGVAGVYSFTPDGNLTRSYQILQVINGELVPVSSP